LTELILTMRSFLAALLVLGATTGGVAAPEALLGRVLEKVECVKAPTQSYALYVPSTYAAEKAWPVIFCFDPGARGLEPVQRLQAAAEKFGVIVAGSLNSRNGPWADNVAAIQAMVGDVGTYLHLDRTRIYTAGLSGGARVATQLALSGMSKGVIACSAGFPSSEEGIPTKVPFVFFGTAGLEDFNYREMRFLDDELDQRGATHRIVVFDGGHEWAPPELLGEAVEWLALREMRAGARPRDEAVIQAALAARRGKIPKSPEGEVWRSAQGIAADFAGLADVAAEEAKAKQLASSPAVKEWRKAEAALLRREEAQAQELVDHAANGTLAPMRQQVAALRAAADTPNDSPERRMAKRVLAGAAMSAREGVRGLLDRGDYEIAASFLEMAVAIRPEATRNYFDLARARALGGDRKRALAALQQAAEKGFSDAARVEDEGAFGRLKSDPAWPGVLAQMRANPPEPASRSRGRP
jgi:dienelactone hydrolase